MLVAMLLLSLGTRFVPYLKTLNEEGPAGRLRYLVLSRRTAVVLATISAFLSTMSNVKGTVDPSGFEVRIVEDGFVPALVHVLVLIAGFLLLLALAEIVTRKGSGNGVMVLTVAMVLAQAQGGFERLSADEPIIIYAYGLSLFVSVVLLVWATKTNLVVPLFSTLPLTSRGASRFPANGGVQVFKVSAGSAGPVLFAGSFLSVIALITSVLPAEWSQDLAANLRDGSSPISLAIFGVLTVLFARLYASVTGDPVRQANDLTRSGRFLLGTAPGRPTARRFASVTASTAWVYALVLAPVMLVPVLLAAFGFEHPLLGGSLVIPVLVITEIVAIGSSQLGRKKA
jgi:preprotein translocase subunit SecY